MQEFSTDTNPGWQVQGGFKQLANGAAPLSGYTPTGSSSEPTASSNSPTTSGAPNGPIAAPKSSSNVTAGAYQLHFGTLKQ